MRDASSPIGIGPPLLQTGMVDRRVDPVVATDYTQAPPSFVAHTSLTSTVASSFVSFLPQHVKAAPTGIDHPRDDLLVSKSLKAVSGPSALNAVLVAGSVSVLMAVVCMLVFICYRKRRCCKRQAAFISKCRTMTMPGKAEDKDDIEASAKALVPSAASNGLTRGQNRRMSVAVDDSKIIFTSSAFCPALGTSSDYALFMSAPKHSDLAVNGSVRESRSDELDEEDLGNLVLSSLQSNASCPTVESHDGSFPASLSILPSRRSFSYEHDYLPESWHSLAPFDCDDSFLESMTFSETPSTLHSSPTPSASDSQFLVTCDTPRLTAIPYSISSLRPCRSHFALHVEPTTHAEVLPRLLELKLDSEVDLRSWLGLDKEEVRPGAFKGEATDTNSRRIPELVTTYSQDSATGTDESHDQNTLQAFSGNSYAYESQQGYRSQMSTISNRVHHASESSIPLFKHASTRSILLYPSIPSPQAATAFAFSDSQFHARTLSPSASFISSSTSITTLRLPSFYATGQKPLVDEVLPPSIIVSVPTDGSLIPESHGSTQFSFMSHLAVGREVKHQLRNSGAKKGARDYVKVIYDPLDEVEDEAWDAYERTCFVNTSAHCCATGTAGASPVYTECWLASSESSELDIGKAIAKFPLPPTLPHSSVNAK